VGSQDFIFKDACFSSRKSSESREKLSIYGQYNKKTKGSRKSQKEKLKDLQIYKRIIQKLCDLACASRRTNRSFFSQVFAIFD
jgi:hypothetical protein